VGGVAVNAALRRAIAADVADAASAPDIAEAPAAAQTEGAGTSR